MITGAMLTLAVGAVLYYSNNHLVLQAAVALLCIAAVYELYYAACLLKTEGLVCISMTVAALLSFSNIPGYHVIAGILLPTAVLLFSFLMTKVGKERKLSPALVTVMAVIIVLLFQSAVYLRNRENGLYELVLAILVCTITDVAAFFVGRKAGKKKLAPMISPGKTVEGCVGGTVAAVLLLTLGCMLIDDLLMLHVNYASLITYLIVASLLGQFGDLSMSAVKRIVGIKDFGNVLPGHGGLLDRFDSLLLVMPMTYLFCTYFGGIFA